MTNKGTLTASIVGGGSITGSVSGRNNVEGNMSMAGGRTSSAVLYIEQELTEEQKLQARENIGIGAEQEWDAGTPECDGIILKSPNGMLMLLAVDDDGNLNVYKSES